LKRTALEQQLAAVRFASAQAEAWIETQIKLGLESGLEFRLCSGRGVD